MVMTQSEAWLVSGTLRDAARDLRMRTNQENRIAELMEEIAQALRDGTGVEVRASHGPREIGQRIPAVYVGGSNAQQSLPT